MRPLRVALPLGIGDCHWSCQKLWGLHQRYPDRPIHAFVNSSRWHESVHYLNMVPFIAKAMWSAQAPFSLYHDIGRDYRTPRWSDRRNCQAWREFDYLAVANGTLERGARIEEHWPDVATAYTYELAISEADRAHARALVPDGAVLLYLSGIGPNIGFHMNRFTPWHWLDLIVELNQAGIEPYIIGANTASDREYAQCVLQMGQGHIRVQSVVGQTTIPQVCDVIQRASVWVGLNSGTGIVSAMQGTPTVMFWSDHRFTRATTLLHANMRHSWLAPAQLATYRTFSYGDPAFTTEAVMASIFEVKR